MTTTTIGPRPEVDLAHAKAYAGIPVSRAQAVLVVKEIAERCYTAGDLGLDCLTAQEWNVLETISGARGNNVTVALVAVVEAYADWHDCEVDVEEWRHRSDVVDTEPMSSERAFDYVAERLDDAIAELLKSSAVSA